MKFFHSIDDQENNHTALKTMIVLATAAVTFTVVAVLVHTEDSHIPVGVSVAPPASSTVVAGVVNSRTDSCNRTVARISSIAGSNAYDITLNLQSNFSIPRGPLKSTSSGSIAQKDSSSSITDKNGLTLSYHLSCANDNSIISGSFTADNLGVVSASNFLAVAKKYLSYCASFPYTAANTDAASTWAHTALDKATKFGTSVAFGDCKFTVYRTDASIWMEIEKFEKK